MNPFKVHLARSSAAILGVLLVPFAHAQCSISAGNDTVICQGTMAQLHGPVGYSNYIWSTGQTTANISTGIAGDYTCQVSYPSGNLVSNGDFSAGNTGFSSQFTYSTTNVQNEGYYAVGTDAHNYHTQFTGTGTGNFLIGNAGYGSWSNGQFDVWCQTIAVCPGQTYTLSYRARTLSNALPARIIWNMDGVGVWPETTFPAYNAGWQTSTITWTSGPAQTSVSACLHVTSGDGVGDDFGIDDITIAGTIVLRDQVHVSVTPLPAVDLGSDTALCQGDVLTLDATVPGGTYLWNNGSGSATQVVSAPGSYSVQVTAQGCSTTDQVAIAYLPRPSVDLGPDTTLCAGAVLDLSAFVPGAQYLWQDGSTAATFHVASSGTYHVEVDLNGCTSQDSVQVAFVPLPTVDLGNDTSICQGASLLLDATAPGSGYLWNDGTTGATLAVSAAGTYSVTVTKANCSASDQITVNVDPVPTVDLGPDVWVCPGSQATFDASFPGATYLWNTGSTSPQLTTGTVGTYSVAVTANGCTGTDAVGLANFNLQAVDLGPDRTLCSGASMTLGVDIPGATYLWNTGGTGDSISVASGGLFSVAVTLNGCTVSDTVNITLIPAPVVDLGPDLHMCPGSTAALDAELPGATYLWNNGATTSSIIAGPGSWSVAVSMNGCTVSDGLTIVALPAPAVDLGPDTAVCAGDQVQLSAYVPGATYLWNDGAVQAERSVGPGNWEVTVTANGCTASDAVNITQNPLPLVVIPPDTVLCDSATWTVDPRVQGAASYLWSDSSTGSSLLISAPGTYTVTVSQLGCSASAQTVVTYAGLSALTLGADTTLCPGQSIEAGIAMAGVSVIWQDGYAGNMRTISEAGSYVARFVSGSCSATDVLVVQVTPLPPLDLGPDTRMCQGDTLWLQPSIGGAQFHWQDGSTNLPLPVTTSGSFIGVSTMDACTSSDTVLIAVAPRVDHLDLGPDRSLCPDAELTLDASTSGASYLWNDGSQEATLTVDAPGSYLVHITGPCISASDTVLVSEGRCATSVHVPNAFSPDGDGINETFGATVPDRVNQWEFAVYDRWGERVFLSRTPSGSWDGTRDGTKLPVGVYVWTLRYAASTDFGVEQVLRTGSVTLLR